MNYRILGRTGIKVSEVGLGCEGFEEATAELTEEMVDTAMRKGINFIEIYSSNPDMRARLGQAFCKYPRNSFVVQGHIGSTWQDGQYKRSRNIAESEKAFDDFLQLMKIDYADLGCIHYCDEFSDYDSIFKTDYIDFVLSLKAQGKVKAISMSTHNPEIAKKAALSGLVDVILFSINPAYDMVPATDDVDVYFDKNTFSRPYEGIDPSRAELYQLCQSLGVALIVMKGFAGGLLLSASESPFGKALTPVQCIHYCLTRPAVASVMVGAHSVKEVEVAASYAYASDTSRDYAQVLAGAPNAGFSGHCMYCGHCAPCSVKIDIAAVNKFFDLSQIQGVVPETVAEHYKLLSHHAGECIACGNCMKNCPFGVDIISKMALAAKLFGE